MTSGKILAAELDGVYMLKFIGDVRITLCGTIDKFFDATMKSQRFRTAIIDLTQAQNIDSTALGLLARLAIQTQEHYCQKPTIVSTVPDINRTLRSVGFDEVFELLEEPLEEPGQLKELAQVTLDQEDLRACVVDAHKAMMLLNDSNREKFQDLVLTLEAAS